jgi:hypothetical protein
MAIGVALPKVAETRQGGVGLIQPAWGLPNHRVLQSQALQVLQVRASSRTGRMALDELDGQAMRYRITGPTRRLGALPVICVQ